MFNGKAIRIVAVESDHLKSFLCWTYRPDVIESAFFGDPYPWTFNRAESWLEEILKDSRTRLFSILENKDDKLVGEIILQNIDWRNRSARHAIIIGEPDWRGKGIGTEAIQLSVGYAFDGLNLHRLEADILEHNQAALKAYLKAGFSVEGIRKKAVWRSEGWANVVVVAMVREECK
ncbi:MAG: GNAT family N-acetyltransferase [Meiothermus ruber]|jgi:RimJ/RimL family protein N-acetyltransferase|uniref:GNAT family N-acetyltransferase n=1 Tax=Meiothermus ruber TaxID=277 RepID=UPI00391D2FAB